MHSQAVAFDSTVRRYLQEHLQINYLSAACVVLLSLPEAVSCRVKTQTMDQNTSSVPRSRF